MKLLTFLGVARYSETTYVWQDQTLTTPFAPVASSHFFAADEVIVFLTEAAQKVYAGAFQAAFPDHVNLTPIGIPDGRTTAELWEIFTQVADAVAVGETVVFDITLGLRSSPLIGLLVAAFLRSAKQVKLNAIVYGAYDVRDASVEPPRTPFFDLTPMLNLLAWADAANQFNRTGDSQLLADLLDAEVDAPMSGLTTVLTDISKSLWTLRPEQILQSSANLRPEVSKASATLAQFATLKPFEMVMDNVVDAYAPFGVSDPKNWRNIEETLQKQLALINWYAAHQHWMHALGLASEWLNSIALYKLGETNLTIYSIRKRAATGINNFRHGKSPEFWLSRKVGRVSVLLIQPQDTFMQLWIAVRDLRNDLLHAGMNKRPTSPEDMAERIKDYVAQLPALLRK